MFSLLYNARTYECPNRKPTVTNVAVLVVRCQSRPRALPHLYLFLTVPGLSPFSACGNFSFFLLIFFCGCTDDSDKLRSSYIFAASDPRIFVYVMILTTDLGNRANNATEQEQNQ